MPSPIGHSMVSVAVALPLLPAPAGRTWKEHLARYRWWLLLAVVCGNAPDLDYVPGLLLNDWNRFHHTITHTLGWVVLVSAAASCLLRAVRPRAPLRLHAILWLALLAHLPADWLTADNSFPRGIMFLWPFSPEYLIAPRTLFWALEKSDLQDALQWSNLWAFGMEVVYTAPAVAALAWWKLRPRDPGWSL